MRASAARSISVTMSVPVDLVPTCEPHPVEAVAQQRPPPRGRSPRPRRRSSVRSVAGVSRAARYRRPVPDPAGRVDLRSDTVTRPTPEMRAGDGRRRGGRRRVRRRPHRQPARGGVRRRSWARRRRVFVPSGTMANQIALRVLGPPGTRGALRPPAARRGAGGGGGRAERRRPARHPRRRRRHARPGRGGSRRWPTPGSAGPRPSAVLRRGHPRRGRGAGVAARAPAGAWPTSGSRCTSTAPGCGTPRSPPGARRPSGRRGATTVTACLSKGLGAPDRLAAGRSAPTSSPPARVERKRLGGGMRQVGILAAAGLVALGRIDRLAEDHARARRLAEAVAARWPGSIDPASVHTNIVRFTRRRPGAGAAPPRRPGRAGRAGQRHGRAPRHARRRRRRRRRARGGRDRRAPEAA